MKNACLFLSLLVAAASLAFGVQRGEAAAPAAKTSTGPITGEERDGVRSFKGIPFAAPPVGELRWKGKQRRRQQH